MTAFIPDPCAPLSFGFNSLALHLSWIGEFISWCLTCAAQLHVSFLFKETAADRVTKPVRTRNTSPGSKPSETCHGFHFLTAQSSSPQCSLSGVIYGNILSQRINKFLSWYLRRPASNKLTGRPIDQVPVLFVFLSGSISAHCQELAPSPLRTTSRDIVSCPGITFNLWPFCSRTSSFIVRGVSLHTDCFLCPVCPECARNMEGRDSMIINSFYGMILVLQNSQFYYCNAFIYSTRRLL